MGSVSSESSKIEQILEYYIFQRKIKNQLNNINIKDNDDIKEGYLVNPDWIKEWKKMIGYNLIIKYFGNLSINDNKLDEYQLQYIKDSILKNNIYIDLNTSFLIRKKDFISIKEMVISKKNLENFVNKNTFDKLNLEKYASNEKIEYVFKSQMIIFFFEKNGIIKLLIHSLTPFKEINNLINLKYNFNDKNDYNNEKNFLKKESSNKILEKLLTLNIFEKPKFTFRRNFEIAFTIINEEENNNYYNPTYYQSKTILGNINDQNNINIGIKQPYEINFSLTTSPSFRGLDNVGATCYMNATLQCLANIKPITDYLLNPNKYNYLYENMGICKLTLKYIQVLIGLFCNESRIGSYRPEDFKKIISEYNPLFEGVKANDSKDLIIFLLEIINNELSDIHNKKYNIKFN